MKGKIFNSQEVQAIIAGTKTMFREVTRPQLSYRNPEIPRKLVRFEDESGYRTIDRDNEWVVSVFERCPYRVGQKVFCKESFVDFRNNNSDIFYKSDLELNNLVKTADLKWRPAQHMKQEHSRLTLEITNIKVERLQDISEEDAIKEGVNKLFTEEEMKHVLRVHQIEKNDSYKNYLWHGHIGRTITKKQSDEWEYQCSAYEKAKDSFFSLWNATHKKPEEKFEVNPFVWVVDFKIIN
jgi:hypothetical protein